MAVAMDELSSFSSSSFYTRAARSRSESSSQFTALEKLMQLVGYRLYFLLGGLMNINLAMIGTGSHGWLTQAIAAVGCRVPRRVGIGGDEM